MRPNPHTTFKRKYILSIHNSQIKCVSNLFLIVKVFLLTKKKKYKFLAENHNNKTKSGCFYIQTHTIYYDIYPK